MSQARHPGLELQRALQERQALRAMELIVFLNAGDPGPEVTLELLRVLCRCGVRTVELCVPFPGSPTDGSLLRESHRRALAAGATLTTVLPLAARASHELGLRIVLLADHRHTVDPTGMKPFLRAAHAAGAHATLLHGLPERHRQEYLEESAGLGLGRIMSCFVTSSRRVRQSACRDTEGFVYLVSRFGRTGQSTGFDGPIVANLQAIIRESDKPVAIGFGLRTAADVAALRVTGAAGVIVGSAASAVVKENLATPAQLAPAFAGLVESLVAACVAPAGDSDSDSEGR